MALLLAWVSLGTSAFLASILFVLFIDTRGDRRALKMAQQSIATLQRHVAAQDEQIGDLRALLGLPETAPEQVPRTGARQALLLPASTQRRAPSTIPRKTVITVTPEPDEPRADASDEARLRFHTLTCRPLRGDDATLAECLRRKFRGILDEEKYPNVRHCESAECTPGAWSTCTCSCKACRARRYALSRAQHIYVDHMPFVRLPGEDPEAWALRFADEELGNS